VARESVDEQMAEAAEFVEENGVPGFGDDAGFGGGHDDLGCAGGMFQRTPFRPNFRHVSARTVRDCTKSGRSHARAFELD
jgi:hypothetical protein